VDRPEPDKTSPCSAAIDYSPARRRSNLRKIHTALACACLLVLSGPAHAALDELLDRGGRDVRVTIVAGQRLFVRSRDGVEELADASGRVFAARWHRRFGPALGPLLGPYRAEYELALRGRPRLGHALLSLRTPRLAVQVHVRPRGARGSICALQHLPKGVTLDAIP
jgi:hypothetical protein